MSTPVGYPNGYVFTRPWPAAGAEPGNPHRVIYYQYRHARPAHAARQRRVAKAERAVEGKAPVKRNRYIQLSGATKSVNRQLEAKTRALAGWKGYADGGVMPTGDGSCLVGVAPGLDSSA
jgi:hypothetical protein